MSSRIDDPALDIDANSVIVLQSAGPQGAPGMPEWGQLPIPQKLLKQGVRDMVRVSDARMSGTSYGACVLHVAPESHIGGPLALVQDGDLIKLDIEGRRIDLMISEEEMVNRKKAWKAPEPKFQRGYGTLYLKHIQQANQGCDFDFLLPEVSKPEGEPEILDIPGRTFRKAGLGKDVTDKVLGGLPGIGPRSAERIALHLVQSDAGSVRELAEAILGLRPVTSGRIALDGEVVDGVNPRLGFVFQRDAIFPWKTVAQNVGLPLLFRGVDAERARRGYHLNAFLYSLMSAANRAEFLAGERKYLQKFPMTDAQRDAVVNRTWNTLLELGGFNEAKAKGQLRLEGKDYIVKDGDVLNFLFNV